MDNTLDPAVAKELACIREQMQGIMKILNDLIVANSGEITATQDGLMETYEQVNSNSTDIENCNNALIELYELIEKGGE